MGGRSPAPRAPCLLGGMLSTAPPAASSVVVKMDVLEQNRTAQGKLLTFFSWLHELSATAEMTAGTTKAKNTSPVANSNSTIILPISCLGTKSPYPTVNKVMAL